MSDAQPILYVKEGCPWCAEAEAFLNKHNIGYERVEVRSDPAAFQKMIELSGQDKAPVLDWDGDLLADFGADELEPWLKERGTI